MQHLIDKLRLVDERFAEAGWLPEYEYRKLLAEVMAELQQKCEQADVSRRFDGCSTCKNNIPGVEAGKWCINNCVAGSRYEAVQNGG